MRRRVSPLLLWCLLAACSGSPPASFIDLLAETNAKVEQFQYSPDGRQIVYLSAKTGEHHLWVMNADGGGARPINPNNPVHQVSDGPSVQPRWSPDGQWISYRSRGLLFMIRPDGSAPPVNLTYGRRGSAPVWTPDGNSLVFVTGDAHGYGYAQIASIPSGIPDGPIEVTYLTEGRYNNTDPQISPDGQWLAFTHMSPTTCSDIWSIPANGGAPTRLTNHMPSALSDGDFVAPEMIAYESADGLEIPAFLYRPKAVAEGRAPPLLIYARANTHGNHVNGFYPFIQYFVSKGYVVLAPQVRGSQGKRPRVRMAELRRLGRRRRRRPDRRYRSPRLPR